VHEQTSPLAAPTVVGRWNSGGAAVAAYLVMLGLMTAGGASAATGPGAVMIHES